MASLTDDNEVYAKSGKRYGWLLIIRCTRNVKDDVKSSVKVYEPSVFAKLLEAENETE